MEFRGLLQWHEVRTLEASRCLISGCINKIQHFHPSCCWTGSFRTAYPAEGILLKWRRFLGADLDITSGEINLAWILSSVNINSMPLSDLRNKSSYFYIFINIYFHNCVKPSNSSLFRKFIGKQKMVISWKLRFWLLTCHNRHWLKLIKDTDSGAVFKCQSFELDINILQQFLSRTQNLRQHWCH